LIELITDANHLHESFLKCKQGTDWKESVQRASLNELKNIYHKQKSLQEHAYSQMPFYEFNIMERGKERHIRSLHITDRMVQRCVCDFILLPELSKYLIYDNGASLRDKGIGFTRDRLHQHLWNYYCNYGPEGYILLIDFRKFFDNIDHELLLEAIKKKIKDPEVIELITYLVSTFAIDVSYLSEEQYEEFKSEIFDSMSYEPYHERTGEKLLYKSLGMGSQISQISGIYYPTPIDNYCKIVQGCKYYGRYMDDTYIIHHDKEYLVWLLEQIKSICWDLRIYINLNKTQIQKLDHFTYLKVKYTMTDTGKVIKRVASDSVTRERQKLKTFRNLLLDGYMTIDEIINQYKSWRGGILRLDSYRTIQNMDAIFLELFGINIEHV
jgi:hypothetical protein